MNDSKQSDHIARFRARHIVQWGLAYLAAAWAVLEGAELLSGIFDWSSAWLRVLTILLVFGFAAALILAWFHGDKGQQRVSGIEVFMLLAVAIVAGVILRVGDYSLNDQAGILTTTNSFAAESSRRITASGHFEAGPSWSPDSGNLVMASERSGNSDLWLLQRSGEVSQLTFDEAEEGQAAWSPDGRTILFVSSRNHGAKLDRSVFFGYTFGGDIWGVPAFGGEASKLVDDGYNPAWAPSGERFAFDSSRDGPRRVWIALANGEIESQLSRDASDLAVHIRPSWSPNGEWIVYERQPGSQAGAGMLVLVSTDGQTVIQLTDGKHHDMAPAWAGPASIVFSSDRGGALNLWQIDINFEQGKPQGEPAQITRGAGEDFDAAVAHDGTLAYISLRRVQNLWQVTVDPKTWQFGTEPERIMDASWNDFAPALSHDKSRTAFSSDRGGSADIWLLERGSSQPRQITNRNGQDLQPVWSPDDTRLAFFSDANGNNDIWILPLGGTVAVATTPPDSNDINPYWSPGGDRIGFTSDRSGRGEVWTMNVDGSDAIQLTDIGTLGHTARWSPDGKWLLFTSLDSGDRDIWAVNSIGQELRRLTTSPSQDAHGLWSPDGQTVMYLSDHQRVLVRDFNDDSHKVVFDLGETIDYVHLSHDGTLFQFTRQEVEGDVWLIE
jgi:Tol biopolymer transport system component